MKPSDLVPPWVGFVKIFLLHFGPTALTATNCQKCNCCYIVTFWVDRYSIDPKCNKKNVTLLLHFWSSLSAQNVTNCPKCNNCYIVTFLVATVVIDKQLSTLIKLSNESRYLVEVSLVPTGRPCCRVRVVSKLGPSCFRLGSDSSWVRKIPRVGVVLGPSCPATYSIPMLRRPSVVVRRPSVVHNVKDLLL